MFSTQQAYPSRRTQLLTCKGLCRIAQLTRSSEQAVEKVCQRHSRFVQRLNVQRRVRFASSLTAALPAERRVLARRGWAGEKAGLFEQPAGCAGPSATACSLRFHEY